MLIIGDGDGNDVSSEVSVREVGLAIVEDEKEELLSDENFAAKDVEELAEEVLQVACRDDLEVADTADEGIKVERSRDSREEDARRENGGSDGDGDNNDV